jgi:hypothetical protein
MGSMDKITKKTPNPTCRLFYWSGKATGLHQLGSLLLPQYFSLYTLLEGTNVRLNWNIESDLNVYWIKFKNFFSLY